MIIKYSECAKTILADSFDLDNHYYNKVRNAQIHSLVKYFMNMCNESIIERYCHLNPAVDKRYLLSLIKYKPNHIYWSGTDLFHVTTAKGNKRMVVIETNTCPSGQKSMPLLNENQEMGGYKRLLEQSFLPLVNSKRLPKGALAVVYDKNYMEASGYASVLADLTNEKIYLVTCYSDDTHASVRFSNGIMEVKDEYGMWIPIRAAFRYVTQKPWNRIPIKTKTFIYNPIIACLAGGRNKLLASKAYDLFNTELKSNGLRIHAPETIMNVRLEEIPIWIEKFGGHAVIKNPYSNAGQGVYTITNNKELEDFMSIKHDYQYFIVQSLIGNYEWSTISSEGKFYHVGMIPNKRKEIYIADLRFMIATTPEGFKPIAMYSRRAKSPIANYLDEEKSSWDMLGTNLSIKIENGWDSDTNRLKLMDIKDFNLLGLSLDNLIEGYIQSVISTIAIDKMAIKLTNTKKQFRKKLFTSLNPDPILNKEIITSAIV